MKNEKTEICKNCGTINNYRYKAEGINKFGFLLFTLIMSLLIATQNSMYAIVFFNFMAVIIIGFKYRRSFRTCGACEAENSYIDIETPIGKKIHKELEEYSD